MQKRRKSLLGMLGVSPESQAKAHFFLRWRFLPRYWELCLKFLTTKILVIMTFVCAVVGLFCDALNSFGYLPFPYPNSTYIAIVALPLLYAAILVSLVSTVYLTDHSGDKISQ